MQAAKAAYNAAVAWLRSNVTLKAVGTFLLQTAAVTALNYGITKLTAKKGDNGLINSPLQLTREPLTAHRIIYGRTRIGGSVRFEHATGGNTNEYLHLIIVWACHECEAIDALLFGDETVPLDGSGNATGTYAGVVRAIHHLGAWDQTADTTLIAEAGGKWTSTDRLRGRCYTYLRLKNDAAKFPGGLPLVTAIVRGRKVYDPREETQSATDPSTWTYSTNAILCTYDYARGVPQLNADEELVRYWGAQLDDEDIHLPTAIASANICDEAVDLDAGGTEPRYAINGAIDANPGAAALALSAFESACAGKFYDVGGELVLRAGAWYEPDVDLDVTALRGPVGFSNPLPWNEKINHAGGTYRDPDRNWNRVPFPFVDSDTYKTEDAAELAAELDFALVTSPTQCQRLAKIAMLRTRQGLSHNLPCNLRALPALTGENYRFTFDPLGWDAKAFELLKFGLSIEQDKNGRPVIVTDLTGQENAASVFDWATDEESTIDAAPNSNLPDPRSVINPTSLVLTSGPTTIHEQEDGTVVPRLKVAWTVPADQSVRTAGRIQIQYQVDGASEWTDWTPVPGDQTFDYITDVRIGTGYKVRIRSINNLGVVAATYLESSVHTVVGKTGVLVSPSGVTDSTAFSTYGYPPAKHDGDGVVINAGWLFWDEPSDPDVIEMEILFTSGLTPPDNTDPRGTGEIYPAFHNQLVYYVPSPNLLNWHAYLRKWDNSGNKSNWTDSGTLVSSNGYTGNLGAQNADAVELTGLQVGGSGAVKVLAEHKSNPVITLTGGSPSEILDVSISGKGFSTKPDGGFIICMSSDNIEGEYDFDSASSTSSNARFKIRTKDGTNLPAGLQRFSIDIFETD